jgi:DNA-directed RNA polymerase specialized sigma24 family protein
MDLRDLVRAAAAGDRHSWSGLVDRFGELVWSTVRAHGLRPDDSADVVQTTWLRLAEQLHGFQDEHDRLGVWLAVTARRESRRLLRSGAGTAAVGEETDAKPAGGPPSGADNLVWWVVHELPEHCRRLLRVLMSTPPPSYEEVAAALDLPVDGIARARAECLEEFRRRMVGIGIKAKAADS